jgi:hypothetical protein
VDDSELFDLFMGWSSQHAGEFPGPREALDGWLDHIDQTAPWLKFEALGFADRVQTRTPHE